MLKLKITLLTVISEGVGQSMKPCRKTVSDRSLVILTLSNCVDRIAHVLLSVKIVQQLHQCIY